MTTHIQMIEDKKGDVVDVNYFCSGFCYTEHTGLSSVDAAWPGGSKTDYDVHCASCERLLWRGIEESQYCPICWQFDNCGDCNYERSLQA